MTRKVFIFSVFLMCIRFPEISFAQNKVVVIPLMSDCNKILTVTSAGQVWMDRNLGAHRVAQSSDDYQAYGWLYQWGRLADGHELRHSPTTSTLSTGDVPGHSFFINHAGLPPWDWRTTQNDNLWQGVSGINNPCPTGFRLPTETEWEKEVATWTTEDSVGAIESKLKLPLTGFRNDEYIQNEGEFGYYWTSNLEDTQPKGLEIRADKAGIVAAAIRAYGSSVRCIRD